VKIRAFSPLGLLSAVLLLLTQAASAAPVVYLAGDSTVATLGPGNFPQQGWGGKIAGYFSTGITFSNRAIGGRSSKSFVDEGRLAAILALIKPGDYLLIQFGHNDIYSDPRLYTEPYTSYKTYLSMYVDLARQYGAIPVLVTPPGKRRVDSSGRFVNDFVDRAAAMKQLAAEKYAPLIDLNAKSIGFYNGLGLAASADVFLWLSAGQYPNFPNGVSDPIHFQDYGAGQLARLVVQGIEENRLAMRGYLGAVNYPAEAALLAGAGSVRTRLHAGWRGKGYVDFPASGGSLTFTNVVGKAGGLRTVRIRYAHGGSLPATGMLTVNGVASPVSFNPTGGWSTWATMDLVVPLRSRAANTISLHATGDDLGNVDELTVL
jgi:lysophospholipase L1-like esterase